MHNNNCNNNSSATSKATAHEFKLESDEPPHKRTRRSHGQSCCSVDNANNESNKNNSDIASCNSSVLSCLENSDIYNGNNTTYNNCDSQV